MSQSPFFVKLRELEQDDQRIRECLRLCNACREEALRRSRREVEEEYERAKLHLEDDICDSRSPAISKLAQAQYTYFLTAQRLMEESLPSDLHSEASTPGEDRTEAMMLYAEYAIDFARQSMRYALLAALSAMEMERKQERYPAGDEEESVQ